jgi:glycosyltransferase involved in cell wall biosynthesis
VGEEDLPVLYSSADLFIFPSLYEGFGLPPLEAMACGCPVISSHTSCMPEILGDASIYFNPYEVNDITQKIQLVLETKVKDELIQKGKERAKIYNVERMTAGILAVFEFLK